MEKDIEILKERIECVETSINLYKQEKWRALSPIQSKIDQAIKELKQLEEELSQKLINVDKSTNSGGE